MLLKAALATAVAGLLLVAPLAGEAQPPGKIPRIGFLSAASSSGIVIDGFRQGLREHGYVEGQNLLIEWRFAEGRNERLSGLAAELVRSKLEIIVTVTTPAALAAKKATGVIPIVFTIVSDPCGLGTRP